MTVQRCDQRPKRSRWRTRARVIPAEMSTVLPRLESRVRIPSPAPDYFSNCKRLKRFLETVFAYNDPEGAGCKRLVSSSKQAIGYLGQILESTFPAIGPNPEDRGAATPENGDVPGSLARFCRVTAEGPSAHSAIISHLRRNRAVGQGWACLGCPVHQQEVGRWHSPDGAANAVATHKTGLPQWDEQREPEFDSRATLDDSI
jgi:hypothetical protein